MCPILDVVCGFLADQLIKKLHLALSSSPLWVLTQVFFQVNAATSALFLTCEWLLTFVSVSPGAATK